ncbi:CBO0543 family protein [Bacillus sp. PK3_68]|uniref:CBO0543 family protein n=1 Tax=Bacillus sp. PK3_68 TaxID=2027408 RepID=UPI000E77114D|nr:CBO0543 family protein [Bacillus sp. PK3_68]RJS60137.1 hypothetical protein CJ483_08730 [Bacillus sp. PK3_68]
MIYHIILGFVLPWTIAGVYLCKKHTKLTALFLPVGSAIAFLFNDLGLNHFWELKPSFKATFITTIPYDLGIYPILFCLFITAIHYKKLNLRTAFLLFILGTTLFEFISVLQNKVIYRNGWNIFLTACSYLLAYIMVFFYYRLLIKLKIL